MTTLDSFALILIETRQQKIVHMGHRAIDPLPSQLREPVLYANALLTQLQMLRAQSRTQEMYIVSDDLSTGKLDLEI